MNRAPKGDIVMINTLDFILPIAGLDMVTAFERFKDAVIWLASGLDYNEEKVELTIDTMNYNAKADQANALQIEPQFLIIEKTKFRTILQFQHAQQSIT